MPWFNNTAYLKMIDSMAIIIAQAYQLARNRLASASSPFMRAVMQRDQLFSQIQWIKRELEILRQQREDRSANKRPDFSPEQRLAIIQLMRQRNWRAVWLPSALWCIPTRSANGSGPSVDEKMPNHFCLRFPGTACVLRYY